jgi:hypothetical protein
MAGIAGTVRAQSPMPHGDLLTQLLVAERQFWDGWQHKTPDVFRSAVRRDGFFYGAYGFAQRDSVFAGMVASINACVVRSYRLDSARAIPLGADAAMLTYIAHQDATCDGQLVEPVMNGVSTYVREHDRWLNVMRAEVPAPRVKRP